MVVGGDGADAQEEDAEGSRQGRCRGAFRQRPTEEPSHRRPRASPRPTSLRQKLQKRRGSGSFLKFWLVSENSVAAPPHGERCHHGGVNATSAHTPPEA